MENKSNTQHFSAPQLCAKCCAFYANPQFGNYCSGCYKELNLQSDIEKRVEKIENEELIQSSQIIMQNSVKQPDPLICWLCTKRAGIMAYKCKCEYTYCKKHRLPENHNCEFDFVKEGKQMLTKANPNIQNDKIERI